jgi:hypothetical protein
MRYELTDHEWAAIKSEIAKEFPNTTDKRVLFDMAQAWLRLCEINEKLDHALQDAKPTAPSPLRKRPLDGI